MGTLEQAQKMARLIDTFAKEHTHLRIYVGNFRMHKRGHAISKARANFNYSRDNSNIADVIGILQDSESPFYAISFTKYKSAMPTDCSIHLNPDQTMEFIEPDEQDSSTGEIAALCSKLTACLDPNQAPVAETEDSPVAETDDSLRVAIFIPVDIMVGMKGYGTAHGVLTLDKIDENLSKLHTLLNDKKVELPLKDYRSIFENSFDRYVAEFDRTFDLKILADVLTEMSKKGVLQIGMNVEEAEGIVNQHSHYYCTVIAEVTVPVAYLGKRENESELSGRVLLNGSRKAYFTLNPDTNFSATDILTVRPDHNHARSQRYVDQTPMEELWPGKHVIDARALHRLALEAAAAKSSAPMSQDKTEKPGSIDKPSSPRSSFFSSGKEIASVDGVASTIGHLVTPQ